MGLGRLAVVGFGLFGLLGLLGLLGSLQLLDGLGIIVVLNR
jgi:hypothetical protein